MTLNSTEQPTARIERSILMVLLAVGCNDLGI